MTDGTEQILDILLVVYGWVLSCKEEDAEGSTYVKASFILRRMLTVGKSATTISSMARSSSTTAWVSAAIRNAVQPSVWSSAIPRAASK